MDIFITILLTVFMFSVLILVHETGHFLTAKLFKVRVNEFSLGMGPRLFKFGKRETVYSVRAFPIGGYVSMEGEDAESDDPRSFRAQKVWKRVIICAAGVFMNFLLGLIIAVCIVASSSGNYLVGTTVSTVISGENTENPLQKGDKIVAISGYRIFAGEDVTFGVSRSDPTGKKEITELVTNFTVIRNGKKTELKNVHPFVRITDENGQEEDRYSFYVNPEKKSVLNVIRHGFFQAYSYIRSTVLGLCDLITGRVGIDSLGSVVKIGQVVGQAAKQGALNFFYLAALISVNLGVMNLLPIPALDGGRIVLLIFEGIFRRPLNGKLEYGLIAGSMLALYLLVFLVTIKDIISIF